MNLCLNSYNYIYRFTLSHDRKSIAESIFYGLSVPPSCRTFAGHSKRNLKPKLKRTGHSPDIHQIFAMDIQVYP